MEIGKSKVIEIRGLKSEVSEHEKTWNGELGKREKMEVRNQKSEDRRRMTEG